MCCVQEQWGLDGKLWSWDSSGTQGGRSPVNKSILGCVARMNGASVPSAQEESALLELAQRF